MTNKGKNQGAKMVTEAKNSLVTLYPSSLPPTELWPVPRVTNVVSTVNLDICIDLKLLALSTRNIEFNPKRFSAAVMRIREPKATALVFRTGKLVITGAASRADGHLAGRKFARAIQKALDVQPKYLDFKVQNLVASVSCGFLIRLEGIARAHTVFAQYEPQLFPGLVYRVMKPKVALLIFVNGKIVLTGAKTEEDMRKAYNDVFPILWENQLQPY